MNIAVKGQPNQIEELRLLLATHPVVPFKNTEIDSYDIIFDLDFDDTPEQIQYYMDLPGKLIIVGAVKIQLEEILAEAGQMPSSPIIGMNTLPTFINRSLLEVCALNEEHQAIATQLLSSVGLETRWVGSRVGLVTPRIVCMIINEAYFTLQEGTASRADIDLGMKLGTAYPKGPFEWSQEIGLEHVYETLEAMYQDTKDERYKICSMLKTEYLKGFIET
jgi:3-hydroxybutyryl-CoA dehydrogenase